MYFTIEAGEPSSATLDARRSFNTLRAHAHRLAGLSASLGEEAKEATSAYRSALTGGSAEAWRRFVSASLVLARHGEALDALLHLDESDRSAWQFFKQIVEENADLIDCGTLAVA